jgi:hypothetical protein
MASTSPGKISALVQRALCKMWAAHPMPRMFIFKSLVVSLANTLIVPFLADPPKFVLQLSPQKAMILFHSLYYAIHPTYTWLTHKLFHLLSYETQSLSLNTLSWNKISKLAQALTLDFMI